MRADNIGLVAFLAMLALAAAVIFGWVANIAQLVGLDWGAALSIEAILRILGIPFIPLGVVMGYI